MFQIRFEHHCNGFSFFTNGLLFRRKRDAEWFKKMFHNTNNKKKITVQVIKLKG